jgi:regulator of sigma E protease
MGSYFLSHLHALGGGVVGYLVPFLFVLSLVVFFHELGHFLVARWCGVRILVFSIGFGPEIVGFNDRYGTRWKIAAIPLGGYVKFFGDENAASMPDAERLAGMDESEKSQSFVFQPVAKRAAIVVAGPMANFLLAIIIFAGIFMLYGKQSMTARVDTVQADSAAAAAGFQPGDLVVAINGGAIGDFADMQRVVSESAGEPLTITVDRKGMQVVLKATPALKEIKDNFGNVHRIGILGITRSTAAEDLKFQPVPPPQAVWMGVQETWFVIDRTLSYIGGVVVGRGPSGDRGLRGPHSSSGRAVGVDRAFEPVPDPAPRWRSPFVLFNRGAARPAAVGTRPGGRLPHRPRNRLDVDDICNFQRHSSLGDLVKRPKWGCTCGGEIDVGTVVQRVGTWQKYAWD